MLLLRIKNFKRVTIAVFKSYFYFVSFAKFKNSGFSRYNLSGTIHYYIPLFLEFCATVLARYRYTVRLRKKNGNAHLC